MRGNMRRRSRLRAGGWIVGTAICDRDRTTLNTDWESLIGKASTSGTATLFCEATQRGGSKENTNCRGHLRRSPTAVNGLATVCASTQRKKPKRISRHSRQYEILGLSSHTIRSIKQA